MATATMATAAGAAALLYYTLNRKLQADNSDEEGYESDQLVSSSHAPSASDRIPQRLIQAPATWLETISTLSETLKFTYSETLGKWPIGDLAFGISFLLKRQGNIHVSDVFGGKDSLQLKGSDIAANLTYLLHLLTLCWHFSKKPFPLFLKETGYSEEHVLLQEPKAGILKPAFTILADHTEKCFLLLIRGTHSIKDTLTAVTGAVVPFHHSVVNEGGVCDVVLGYAHCGMVAAARWIAKLATPVLLEALKSHPDYKLKIVGHSLGGGTAALLTYVLREQKELSTATCVAFAPAACMTWELAESGNDFITCVINGADLVPTFSAASVDDLRAEVTASAWLNDLRNQIERTRILGTVYRSASALGSRLPSISTAKAKVAGAGALLRPVSNRTQVVMKRAQSMAHAAWSRPTLGLSSWSCMGPRRRAAAATRSNKEGDKEEEEKDSISNSTDSSPTKEVTTSSSIDDEDDPLLLIRQHNSSVMRSSISEAVELPISSGEWSSEIIEEECSCSDRRVEELDRLEDRMTEVELWQQLEQELYDRTRMDGEEDEDEDEDEDVDVVKEMREEEAAAIAEAVGEATSSSSAPQTKESHRFFPPGRIMHIVTLPFESDSSEDDDEDEEEEDRDNNSSGASETEERCSGEAKVAIFLTQRSLYSKIRLSQSMINDHFMPIYRRQIEKLIKGMEKKEASTDYDSSLLAKTKTTPRELVL